MFKKITAIFLCFILTVTSCGFAYADDISASCAIVVDQKTGAVLYEKNCYAQRAIASTTKIMTCLLAIESGRLDETVRITDEMLRVEGSSLGIKNGDRITLIDLVIGMMLTSGNDSANAVACFVSGSVEEFCKLMNKRATELGMINTHFVTPSGLDEGDHHSTAYDMALLSAYAVRSEVFCDIVSKQSAVITVSGKPVTVYNHNKLLARDKSIFGIKTGYTKLAGRCLVTAKHYKGNVMICVTLNCPDDWEGHLALYKKCRSQYKKQRISNTVRIKTASGEKKELRASYNAELYSLDSIVVYEHYYPFVYSPVEKGDTVGTAYVYSKNSLTERLPIEADEDLIYSGTAESGKTSKVYGRMWSRFKKKK